MAENLVSSEVYSPDRLFSGDFPVVSKKATILSGENFPRGTVLGKVTADGKYKKSLSTASDGSENPSAIAAKAVDASAGDKKDTIYLTGQFNQNALTFGASHTADSIRDDLRLYSIFLEEPVKA